MALMDAIGAAKDSINLNAVGPDDFAREVYGVLGIPLDATDLSTVLRRIKCADDEATPFLISTVNLNYLLNSRRSTQFRNSLLLSDLCVADGMPIVWISRLFLNVPVKERIAGSDIFEALKSRPDGSSSRVKVFLLGDADGVAAQACKNVNEKSKNMICVGSIYPGFGTVDEMSTNSIIEEINSSDADFLVIALGAEKGQAWLQRNHDRVRIPIRCHLGATIKYEAGIITRAPVFLRVWGLEWLWRIKEEPLLWRRYLKDGLVLIGLMITQVIPLAVLIKWHRIIARREPQNLAITRSEDAKSVILRLNGAATAEHAGKALPYFQDAAVEEKPVTIDFANARLIDARFIGLLLMLNKQLTKRGLPLTLSHVMPPIERFIRLSGFGFLLSAWP